MPPTSPYGTWPSPLSAADVAGARLSRSALASDGTSLWWLEARPQEGGRSVLVRLRPGSSPAVVSPEGTSVRSRVHEYGGGAWCLLDAADGAFAFVDDRTQRVFASVPGGPTVPLGAEGPEDPEKERWRHGGLVALGDRSVLAVRERLGEGPPARSIVRLAAEHPVESTLCSGRDFYGSVAVSPDRRRLAWVLWDHPDMPWDATELWVGELGARGVSGAVRVGLGVLDGASVDQPVWTGPDTLCFVADAAGWWQPWRMEGGRLERRCDLEAEFQGPAWTFGQHTLVDLGEGRLGCVWRRLGVDHVGVLEPDARLVPLDQPCVAVSSLCETGGGLAWLGQRETTLPGLWWSRAGGPAVEVAGGGRPGALASADVSVAEPLSVGTAEGTVHAAFYPPVHIGWRGPEGAAPPLVVCCHGGPTSSATAGFDPVVQMLTTRGYAVATVDYAGSTGYGRRYRQALEGRWGEADVDDCVAVAGFLADAGRVDGEKMAIRGGSAGGLTALGALVRSDCFCAAVSWYGVSDLATLVSGTHDFESRYTERLVGPLPEAAAAYAERSPVRRADDIDGAVLLLQGEDDPVVPPGQTLSMAEALRSRGLQCRTLLFPGESHGFRRAETLLAAYQAELAFYAEILAGGDGSPP